MRGLNDDELTADELRARYYRWWTLRRWGATDRHRDRGWKIGPVTIAQYDGYWLVTLLGRWSVYDGILRAMNRGGR